MRILLILLGWAHDNPVLATLIATALVNSMRPELPRWNEIHTWLYGWAHDAAKLFMNYRSGAPPSAPNQSLPNQPAPQGHKEAIR
jgi:hypothetical protein